MLRTIAAALVSLLCVACGASQTSAPLLYLRPPEQSVYHAAHPDFGPRDDLVTPERVRAFTGLAGKEIVWAFVSFHWDRGIVFPSDACLTLNGEGVTPLVGIMPWSTLKQGEPEPLHTLEKILSGAYDDELRACAAEVKSLGFPIMIEFGPEANGSWFPWSGAWNGRDRDEYGARGHPDGPERFRDTYRHIVDLFRAEGAEDVTWVFHLAFASAPDAPWNAMKYYYPGDNWVDWIGVSLYGRRREGEPVRPFEAMMGSVYPELAALSSERPLALLELGLSDDSEGLAKARWITDAMRALREGLYPRVRAVSWWNKTRRPDGSRSTLEIDSSPQSLSAYRESVRDLSVQPVWGLR